MLQLEWSDADGAQTLEFDCVPRMGHDRASTITEHAVERGAAISDHVRPGLQSISIDAVVSGSPIRIPGTAMDGVSGGTQRVEIRPGEYINVLRFDRPIERRRVVDEMLQRLQARSTLITVRTDLRTIESCAIENYHVEIDDKSGDALILTLSLKQVKIVSIQRVQVPPAQTRRRTQATQQRGAQAAQTPDNRSAAARAFDRGTAEGRQFLQRLSGSLFRSWGM
jgi:hypothetical protein